MDRISFQDPAQVLFDWERGEQVLRTILESNEKRTHLFSEVHQDNGDAPQRKHVPAGVIRGSLEHQQWLYFSVLTDRRQISEEVYKNHVMLHREFPWLYKESFLSDWQRYKKETASTVTSPPKTIELFDELRLISEMSPNREMLDFLTLILESRNIGVPRQSAKYWIPCMRTLYKTFHGDPLQIYQEGSIDAILEWCRETERSTKKDPLPGFGPKLMSLLALFFEELGLLPPIEGAFPVDVHIQRIFISTNVVTGSATIESDKLAEKLRRPLCAICYKNGWSTLRTSHALWFNGNRNCSGCSDKKDIEYRCPIYSLCGGSIESRSYFTKGKWHLHMPRLSRGRQNYALL